MCRSVRFAVAIYFNYTRLFCCSYLFFHLTEAAAARAAGMLTILLQRPGNVSLSEEERSAYPVVKDFVALHTLKQP